MPPDLDHEKFMRLAVAKAREGLATGGSPFGACIVSAAGDVLACEHNVVWQQLDATAHAEVTAIRAACRAVAGVKLPGATIYSTTEPCPMCFAAIHWAGIARIVYGSTIADAQRGGFGELAISNADLKRLGNAPVDLLPHFLSAETNPLFDEWLANENRRVY